MGLGGDFLAGGEGAAAGAAYGAFAGPVGSAVGAGLGFSLGFFIHHDFFGSKGGTKPASQDPGKPNPPPPPPPPSGPPPSDDGGSMHDFAGFARPFKGPIGLNHYFGRNPVPLHVDKARMRENTRIILRDMANKRALEEIDTAMGRKRPRDMRHRRRRIDPDVLRRVRRRLDVQGLTDFAEEARRVWDDVQPFLPRH